uniref:two-partner secretion domain-containing protein n=1 Tax=Yersinia frederiksenii TaxID=29484 RepID=UPI001F4C4CA1|nr:filamentous hemagglutinin N-terminal domain-containing protein [Yersinia frederiksenii]ULG20075.1 heme utilization protein [Yersinia frederiksenii]ULG20168.1 heme utilization protein [Yersinia frederiksenii]
MAYLYYYYIKSVRYYVKKFYFILLLCSLIFISPYSLSGIVVDMTAAKNQQPDIYHYIEQKKTCKVQNAYCQGAIFTTINIVSPDAHGVSHNKYNEFNIAFGRGFNRFYLNNLEANSPGFVGNPNLVNQTAKIILNEVTSNKQSRLYGSLSVIGQKAHVIIANPSGISCNGCQFTNTERVTLTTGVPIFNSGVLTGYDVNQGNISIDGNGLKYNDNLDNFLELFSASLNIDGEIHSGIIQAIIGKKNITLTSLRKRFATQLKDDRFSNKETNVVIDVTQLGGMYANKIFLYANSGGIQNKGMIDADAVAHLASTSFIRNSSGRIYASKLKLRGLGDVDNIDGRIKSERQGVRYKANEKFGIRMSGHNINNRAGSIYANSGYTSIEATGFFNNWDGVIKSNAFSGPADIRIKAKIVANDYGQVVTSQGIQIDTSELRNNKGRIVSAFKDVDLRYKTLMGEDGVIHAGIEINRTIKS